MNSSCIRALALAEMIPTQRAQPRLAQMPKAANSWTTPTISRIQPQLRRSAKTYLASWTKNVDLSIAAMPY